MVKCISIKICFPGYKRVTKLLFEMLPKFISSAPRPCKLGGQHFDSVDGQYIILTPLNKVRNSQGKDLTKEGFLLLVFY